MKKIVGSTLDLSPKAVFSLDNYQLKNQTNPFAYRCSWGGGGGGGMGGGGWGEGNIVEMLKNTLL